jgi:tetratricopeptide (TPR) repeat protein
MKTTPASINFDDSVLARRQTRSSRILLNTLTPLLIALISVGCSDDITLEDVRAMQAAGQMKTSLQPLRDMVDAKTDDPEVYFLYGRALSMTSGYDAALWPLRRAMESEDWLLPAGMQFANNAFDTGNNETAIDVLDKVIEVSPEKVSAIVLRARARIASRKNIELALVDADLALEIDPDSTGAQIARILALLSLEMVEEAGEALEAIEDFAFETAPDELDSARFCGVRASFASEKGETEVADERYTRCLELFPGADILVSNAIKFYDGERDKDRVISILETAVKDSPDSRTFRIGLARRLSGARRVDDALEVLRAATGSSNPSIEASAWMDLAGFLIEFDRIEEGGEAFEKVLEAEPNPSPELLFRYADILLIGERYDEALTLAESMKVPAHQFLIRGRVYLERKEYAEALAELSEGLQAWPDNAVARYYAALAAEGVGDYERAIEEYRYSIRAGASETDARLRLGRLHHAEGAFQQAIVILRHDLSNNPTDIDMAELELEILASQGRAVLVPKHLLSVINRPKAWQRGIAAIAKGLKLKAGPASALKFIEDTQVDLTDVANKLLLREYVRYLADDGRVGASITVAEASVTAHPDEAVFHAILGMALLRSSQADDETGADESAENVVANPAKAKAEFDRAIELDANEPFALAGAGLAAQVADTKETALDYYFRADAADPSDSAPLQQAIDILLALGRAEEAEANLEKVLERNSFSGPAALKLLELRVARGAGDEPRSVALANLAKRFGGNGPAAAKVLKTRGSSRSPN